jgi:transcriptional regulator with XRE-family HTH domain
MRQEKKMSQRELARKMADPVDQSTISNWESCKTPMTLEQALDVLMIFGKNWDVFLSVLSSKAQDRNADITHCAVDTKRDSEKGKVEDK